MSRAITRDGFSAALPGVLQEIAQGPVQVLDGDEVVAMIVSKAEYESLLEKRGTRALEALRQLQQMVDDSRAGDASPRASEHALERRAS